MDGQRKCDTFTQWDITQLFKNMKFAAKWIELEKNILIEAVQTQKDKYGVYSRMCGCLLLSLW